jgi:hypothetical protein
VIKSVGPLVRWVFTFHISTVYHVDDNDNDDVVYQLWQDDGLVASGDAEVVALLHQHSICGIQDDYEFWKAHQ